MVELHFYKPQDWEASAENDAATTMAKKLSTDQWTFF